MRHWLNIIYFIITIVTVTLGTFASNLITKQDRTIHQLTTTVTEQQSDNALMASTILLLTDEVQLREDMTSLIVDAARAYNIDPMLLTQLIKSESNFRPNVKHSIPQVKCMSGINLKAHPKVLYNPDTITGCIFASAEILAKYLEESDGLTIALTKYKGFSPLGHTQAKAVAKDYRALRDY